MAEETVRTRLIVDGGEEYRKAAKSVESLERQYIELTNTVQNRSAGWTAAIRHVDDLKIRLDAARESARMLQMQANTAAYAAGLGTGGAGGIGVAPMMGAGGRGGGAGGGPDRSVVASMALLNFGQMMEDAQYGFRAVANQIPMMTGQLAMLAGMSGPTGMALGGLAAIISTVGVQAYESNKEFAKFVDGMLEKSKSFGTMAAHLAPLVMGMAPPDFNFAFETAGQGKTRANFEKTQKRGAAGLSALEKMVSPEQAARAKQFEGAVREFGGGAELKKALLGGRTDPTLVTTAGVLSERAMAGDAAAIKDVEKSLDPKSLRKWQEAMRDNDAKVIESRKIATEAREAEFTATVKQARSMQELSEIAVGLKAEFDAGTITLKQYTDRKKDIAAAEDQIDRKERQKADEDFTTQAKKITTIEQVAKAEKELAEARSSGAINQDQFDSRSRILKGIRANEEIDELNRQGQTNQPGRFQIAQAEEFVARGEMRKVNRQLTRAYFQAGRAATRGVGGQLTRQLLGRQEQAVLGGMDVQEALEDYFKADTDEDRQAVMSRVGKMSGQMQTQFRMGAQQFQMMQRMGLAPSRAEMKAVDQVERLNRKQEAAADKLEKAADKLLSGDINVTL